MTCNHFSLKIELLNIELYCSLEFHQSKLMDNYLTLNAKVNPESTLLRCFGLRFHPFTRHRFARNGPFELKALYRLGFGWFSNGTGNNSKAESYDLYGF
jgi:hypothetical protein